MPIVSSSAQGTPSWLDLSTSDEAAAIEFYGSLFGWTNEANDAGGGMMYNMQKQGDAYVGGIYKQRDEEAAQGIPPHWTTYISVDNVDETVTRVAGAGGQVYMEPYDVMEAGRMAIFAEPTGAVAALWQNRRGTGGTLTGEPNSLCWAELLSDDPDKATKFFEDVLGVESGSVPGPGGNPYIMLKAAGREVAGIFKKPSEMPAEVPSFWLNYFAVADCDATVEKAKSLGGAVLAEPMEPMPGLRLAVLMDPQGASFGVMNMDAPA